MDAGLVVGLIAVLINFTVVVVIVTNKKKKRREEQDRLRRARQVGEQKRAKEDALLEGWKVGHIQKTVDTQDGDEGYDVRYWVTYPDGWEVSSGFFIPKHKTHFLLDAIRADLLKKAEDYDFISKDLGTIVYLSGAFERVE